MTIQQLAYASIGTPITRGGVSLFPVYIHQPSPWITTGPLADVTIKECPQATVPMLQARNATEAMVLLVEGETVVGGQQNRVLNVSVLLSAGTTTEIPVSCVEQGRWDRGSSFGRSATFAPRRVRREKNRSVADSVARGSGRQSDQGAVWSAVHHELARHDAANPTAALAGLDAAFDRDPRRRRAAEELAELGPLPGQCGIVVSHGTRIVAADVFANPELLAWHWPAIVRSHVLDAPDAIHGAPSVTRAVRFLHKFSEAADKVTPGVGLGREHHIANTKVVGQALVWNDTLIHASAFALAA